VMTSRGTIVHRATGSKKGPKKNRNESAKSETNEKCCGTGGRTMAREKRQDQGRNRKRELCRKKNWFWAEVLRKKKN